MRVHAYIVFNAQILRSGELSSDYEKKKQVMLQAQEETTFSYHKKKVRTLMYVMLSIRHIHSPTCSFTCLNAMAPLPPYSYQAVYLSISTHTQTQTHTHTHTHTHRVFRWRRRKLVLRKKKLKSIRNYRKIW